AGKLMNPGELAYTLQDKGDTEIGLTVMYSVLNHYRFKKIKEFDTQGNPVYETDANGEVVTVPAHQAYVKTEKGLVRNPMIEMSETDENRLRNIIYSEMRRAQGNYATADQTKFEETITGKLVFFYRKYLVPQLLNRFGYLRPNWEASEAALGYWRAVGIAFNEFGPGETMKHLLLGGFFNMNERRKFMGENKMGEFMTSKVAHASRDMMMMFLVTMLSHLALAYVRGKD